MTEHMLQQLGIESISQAELDALRAENEELRLRLTIGIAGIQDENRRLSADNERLRAALLAHHQDMREDVYCRDCGLLGREIGVVTPPAPWQL